RKHYGYRMDGLTPNQKITSSLFYSLNFLKFYPQQKVTSILQQYISCQFKQTMIILNLSINLSKVCYQMLF
ncbi:hypothetical protein KKF17_02065, partial [Patescibacteria group bacterium]|nr:hypothetical protein [Patescibacteria group bacterium]